jgi:hypothetical protein
MATEVAIEKRRARQRRVFQRRSSDGVKPAALWLLLAGAASLAIWYFTNDGSMMSMLLALAGISTITLAVLLYFLSPARSVRSDVCDAMAISGTLELRRVLMALQARPLGIFIPPGGTKPVRMFVPLTNIINMEKLSSREFDDATFVSLSEGVAGIMLIPPGFGLYSYARGIGAGFPGVNLEDELGDVFENSLELADEVTVAVEENKVSVTLKNIVDYRLCKAIREEDPDICTQIGCPICSAVGCMIVSGTGKMATIESVNVKGKTVRAEFRLIGE